MLVLVHFRERHVVEGLEAAEEVDEALQSSCMCLSRFDCGADSLIITNRVSNRA
jgi:hypothetical protein